MKEKDDFQISVIIPAYNVEKYVEKAIKSALIQPEVAEVLVIDDGSTDNTPNILNQIAVTDTRIQVLTHCRRKNKGRSASRNLGIKNATSNFIAFLDADDYYLENRFENDKKLFQGNPDIDGVYNAIGVYFYRKPRNKQEEERLKLTTMLKRVAPEELFWYKWPKGDSGDLSGDGLTVKKGIFNKVGYFNEKLQVAEDSELWIKMSIGAKLFPGKLNEAVAIRGVHDKNVFVRGEESIYHKAYLRMYLSLYEWSENESLSQKITRFFAKRGRKYCLKNIAIDKRGFLNYEITIFVFFSLLKLGKKKTIFYLIPVLFFYKTTGRGYFLRRRLINSLEF